MIDYMEAIRRPFSDFKKLLLGWIISLIPIVNFIAFGYQLECGRSANKGKLKLPEWKGYGELFIHGFLSIIIWLIYSIPVIIVFGIIVGAGLFTMSSLTEFSPEKLLSDLFVQVGAGLIIIILVGFVVTYVGYYAIMSYAMNYRFKDGFDFRKIFSGSFTKEYFFGWLVAIIYSMILGFVGTLIPFVGSAITGFVSGVTFLTIIGSVYKK